MKGLKETGTRVYFDLLPNQIWVFLNKCILLNKNQNKKHCYQKSKQEAAKLKDVSRPSFIETGSSVGFMSVLLRSAINICCMWFCDLTTIK